MVRFSKNRLFSASALLTLLLLSGSVGADPAAIESLRPTCIGELWPYLARYDVYRNGKLLGTSVSEMSQGADHDWSYKVTTKATKGMGGILGGKISESARFTVTAGVLNPEHYELYQKVAFSKVRRSADFDWSQNRVDGKNKRKAWQLELQGDETDRLSANILIRQQLAAGKTELSFKTVEKGEVKVRDFQARAIESVKTGLGEMQAIPVHRIHSNKKRSTVTWHAPQLGYLPVRVEHAKKGDDSGKLILTAFEPQECEPVATGIAAE